MDKHASPPTARPRKKKPYVDGNLQLQLPSLQKEALLSDNLHRSVYSHFQSSSSIPPLPFDEQELRRDMEEAKSAFMAWKRLRQRILDRVLGPL